MRVLAICGSAHRGNTYSILKTLEEDHPDVEFQIIELHKADLKECRGCYVCTMKGEELCSLKDDRDKIIKEMHDADALIFASPVYVNHSSALMKRFMERLNYMGHRPCFFGKHAMVLANGGGFGADDANKFMDGIFSVFGFNVVSSAELYVATESEAEKRTNREKANKAFNTLIVETGKGASKPTPTLTQLIYFNIFKAVSELNKEKGTADYEYYKDKTDYYCDANIKFFRKKMANWIAGKEIKKMMEGR